jgi:hypothetical protein
VIDLSEEASNEARLMSLAADDAPPPDDPEEDDPLAVELRGGLLGGSYGQAVTATMHMPGPDGLEETPRWWSRRSGLTLACD